jgi:hypothetical protein
MIRMVRRPGVARRTPGGRARLLAAWVEEHGWTCGVELGVFRGDTFLHLLRTCPKLEMIGVDVWRPLDDQPIYPGGRSYDSWPLEEFYQTLLRQLSAEGLADRAMLIRDLTARAAAQYPDGFFDFVFIDADHTTTGITADLFAWAPKVKPDGWIIGHDHNRRDFPGVVRVVDTVLPSRSLHEDSVWACPKALSVFGL